MQVLTTILYILLFLVFLSILIIVHELGHLAAAKAFNVFCLEYSVGMGPLLFKIKRKKGETQFSVRAIPFGGYVSMYGEGVQLPEGVTVPEERSLNNAKWWKRLIIFAAGVTMNVVLAIGFFFAGNCLPRQSLYVNSCNVSESSIAYEAGLRDGDIYQLGDAINYYDEAVKAERAFYLIDNKTTLNNDDSVKYATCLNLDNLKGFKVRDLKEFLFVYQLDENNAPDFNHFVSPETYTNVQVNFSILKRGVKEETVDHVVKVSIPTSEGKLSSFGAVLFYEKTINSFGNVIKYTFQDFGNSSIALFKAVGELLFKPASWGQVSGIIGVYSQTTEILQDYGFAKFLFVWGFISINLAIFNLLPFPGLDGWQILVLIIETTSRKKIPEKVKNIVSLVGIGLLFLLMGIILVKDIVTTFFMVSLL